jgi:hypothetical protein
MVSFEDNPPSFMKVGVLIQKLHTHHLAHLITRELGTEIRPRAGKATLQRTAPDGVERVVHFYALLFEK